MKLSEAMMLGDSLRTRDASLFLSEMSGVCRGCAIGGALLSVGVTCADKNKGVDKNKGYLEYFQTLWPWISAPIYHSINALFVSVLNDTITFEQLVDCVVSVEPSCGECNCFTCTCKSAEIPVEEMQFVSK